MSRQLTPKEIKSIIANCEKLPWTALAIRDLGKREIKGSKHAEFILACARKVGLTWVRDDETPWCATWVSGKLEMSGISSTRSAWARSYHGGWKAGQRLSAPAFGCVVVFERGPKSGHVGFVVAIDRKLGVVWVLGGNQQDAVTISAFPISRVLGWYWPKGHDFLPIVLPQLASAGAALSTNEA
jgi:uncharacterized protein (TIGR02594 family)